MPELCRFLGVVIAMYYRDHAPPHFHAIYGEYEITVNIVSGSVGGAFPPRVLALVEEWRIMHIHELLLAWNLAEEQKPLPNIAPLE
jgi:hypothetical protein